MKTKTIKLHRTIDSDTGKEFPTRTFNSHTTAYYGISEDDPCFSLYVDDVLNMEIKAKEVERQSDYVTLDFINPREEYAGGLTVSSVFWDNYDA